MDVRTGFRPYGAEDMSAALAPRAHELYVLSVSSVRSILFASPWSPAGLSAGRSSRIVSGTAMESYLLLLGHRPDRPFMKMEEERRHMQARESNE